MKLANLIAGVTAVAGFIGISSCTRFMPNIQYLVVYSSKVEEERTESGHFPSVYASYSIGNDPAVVDAYNLYRKTGKRQTIKGEGWITYPYCAF